MKECVVICNPNSGKRSKKKFLSKALEILKKYGYEAEIFYTKYAHHATEIIEKICHVDLVISIGGDGTFNEVMTGNLKRKDRITLAHLPFGTTNDIGAMFGYTKNPFTNLKLILEGQVKKIDICQINNHPFVYVAGFGKFMNIPYETPRDLKKKYGHLAYLMEGIKALKKRTKLYDLTYELNGETYRGLYSFLLVTNATRVAGMNNVFKNIKLDDNTFEVLFCNLSTKKDIINSIQYLKNFDIAKVPGFYFYKTNHLKITFNNINKKKWCIDGEEFEGNKTYEISIIRGVEVLIPQKRIASLFVGEENGN
jgi:YegS/Rv2252/BmrU family lipid kinase